MKKVSIFLAEGFEEVEALTQVDLLRRAGAEVTMVSISGAREVAGSHGIVVMADQVFTETDFSDMDLLVLPGGMPGTLHLKECAPLLALLKDFHEKAKKLDADAKEFQRKLENNGFATRERAEQEQMRLMKQQQELQALQQKLSDELASENQKNSLQLRDSINSFLKIYNQNKGYDLIISNTGFDNLLYANPAYNITQEIIDGLNARYTPSSVKK